MRTSRRWITLSALLLAFPVIANDPTGPTRFLFLLEATVGSADVAVWANAVSRMAKAHATHPDGNHWTAYRKTTGGPDMTVRFFFPLERLADLDEWKPNRRIVLEALGKDEGRTVLDDLQLEATSSDRIISYNETLSRPWAEPPAEPPRYVWVANVRVAGGKMIEYASVSKLLRKAHDLHDHGLTWLAYGNAIGGDSEEVLFLFPFDTFSEVDSWPSRKEVLTNAHGPEEAARIASALEAISETTTSLWQLEPALSQLKE